MAGGALCFAEPGSWLNRAVGLGMEGPVAGDELDRVSAFYAEQGVPAIVDASAYAHPSLLEGLAARGFAAVRQRASLVRETSDVEAARWPEGVRVAEVPRWDEAALLRFADLLDRGLEPPSSRDAKGSAPALRATARIAALETTRSFLAWCGDEPVGAATLEAGGDLGVLFGASVLPAHRGRGIHAALIAHRCVVARELGCTLALVESAPGGPTERNATRAGFRLAFTRVRLQRAHE